jgi:tetratricopeptide (TPR) repeat protein
MSQHDRPDTTAPGSARPQTVPPGFAAPVVRGIGGAGGFDPVSLRTAVDVPAAEARLAALGQSRSTAALGERADLLRLLGRLDEALAIAEEAFRLAHFTGDRADSTAARIRRAHIFREQGKLDRALNDLHTSRITAATEEWRELEAAAAELEGYTLYDLGRNEEARETLAKALEAYEASGAPRDRTNGLRVAIEGVMRAYLSDTGPQPRIEAPAAGDTNPVPVQPLTPTSPASPAAPARTQVPRVDGIAALYGGSPAPAAAPAPAAEAPQTTEASAVDVDSDGGAAPARQPMDAARTAAISFDPESMPDEAAASPVAEAAAARAEKVAASAPAAPRDGGLWGKISHLAERAAGHRDRDSDEFDAERRGDHEGRAGDRPRTGGTGVTGVVDGLPRDDEPTTWPFPRR